MTFDLKVDSEYVPIFDGVIWRTSIVNAEVGSAKPRNGPDKTEEDDKKDDNEETMGASTFGFFAKERELEDVLPSRDTRGRFLDSSFSFSLVGEAGWNIKESRATSLTEIDAEVDIDEAAVIEEAGEKNEDKDAAEDEVECDEGAEDGAVAGEADISATGFGASEKNLESTVCCLPPGAGVPFFELILFP